MIYLYEGTATDFTYNGQPLPEAQDTVVNYFINDEFYVTFKYPLDERGVYKQIKKDMIITAHTPNGMQPFRIIDPTKHSNYIEVEAWPLFYADMRNKLVRPLALKNASFHTAISQFLNNLLIDTPFEITTNIDERHDYHTQTEEERENNPRQLYDALEIFKAIVNRWNGEVIINGYDIRVVNRIGSNKEALLYEKKNIAEFIDKESLADLVTRLHGKSEWTEEGPDGEQIERSIQTTVDSPLIGAYSGVVFEKQYTNNDIRTEQQLKNWLNLMFTTDNVDKPKRNIQVGTNVIDGQEINAGDSLVLKYIMHDVDMEIRMVGYQYDGFANRYINVYLGDAKESLAGSLQNSITNVENNVGSSMQQIAHTIINSMGQKIIYSPTEPKGNFREGDTWFDNEGGMFLWDEAKADWIPHPYNRRTDVVEQLLKDTQQELGEVKQTAEEAVDRINGEIANKFTDIEVELANVEELSNTAYTNALTSLDHSLDAQMLASQAIESTGSLSVRVDDVENELSIKADKQTVDDLEHVVNLQALDIKANADGLALKANQDTVDLLSGTVSSLGTDIGVVAGQVNSRVWNTDIETAIDGLSYENRNLIKNSDFSQGKAHWESTPEIKTEGYLKYITQPYGWATSYKYKISEGEYTLSVLVRKPDSTSGATLRVTQNIKDASGNELGATRNLYIPLPDVKGWVRVSASFVLPEGTSEISGYYLSNNDTPIDMSEFKLEKGSKSTDWSPAPEDTLARFDHIETEWTQAFDSFSQSVAHIDGRVTSVRQDVDSMAGTITDHTGKIASIEFNVSGLQGIISDPVDGLVTQVSALASGFNILASDFANLEIGISNILTHDESKWEIGGFSLMSGVPVNSNTRFRTKDFIKIPKITHVSLDSTGYGEFILIFYDESKNFIKNTKSSFDGVRKGTYEVPNGAAFMRGYGRWAGNNTFDSIKDARIGVLAKVMVVVGKQVVSVDFWEPAPEDMATQAQLSVLSDNINLRVSKGELLSQINIEAGRTLIQSDRLYLDASSVVFSGSAFIPSAAIQNLTADKITAGTINGNQIRVINLDASSIVSGRIEGIEIIAKVGEIGDWNLNSGVLYSQTRNNLNTTIKATGDVAFAAGAPEPRNTSGATFQLWHSGRLRWLNRSGETAGDIEVIGNQTFLSMYDATFNRINLPRSGFIGLASNGELSIQNSGSLYINPGTLTYFVGDIRPSSNGNYHVGGADYRWKAVWTVDGVNESSDERLKKNIKKLDTSLLERVEDVKPIMYEDQNGKISFGYSAQDVQRTLTQYAYQELGMRESEVLEKFSVLEKGESYLSLRYRDIEVMKGALRDKKIEELENRIKELENAG